ncbi:MAG: hypothetical protein L3K19_05690 [Thermoplasmata archaeon]|nr:hypothetical protein [Thermoplasmata archaeon]
MADPIYTSSSRVRWAFRFITAVVLLVFAIELTRLFIGQVSLDFIAPGLAFSSLLLAIVLAVDFGLRYPPVEVEVDDRSVRLRFDGGSVKRFALTNPSVSLTLREYPDFTRNTVLLPYRHEIRLSVLMGAPIPPAAFDRVMESARAEGLAVTKSSWSAQWGGAPFVQYRIRGSK